MSKRIPVRAARQVADEFNCRQVILLAWDGELTHVVTYGKTAEDCSQAADGGNMLKQKWGWPECNDQPSRVQKLQKENAYLRSELVSAARSLLSYERSYGGGGGDQEAFDIARSLGYEDGLNARDVEDWLMANERSYRQSAGLPGIMPQSANAGESQPVETAKESANKKELEEKS